MKLLITISRRYGTGASQIAGELSEQLGIPVYDKTHVEEKMCSNSYDSEAAVIKELAMKPCIILGRCASEILKDQKNVFNIYVCADRKDRIARIMKKENISKKRLRRSWMQRMQSVLSIIMNIQARHGEM